MAGMTDKQAKSLTKVQMLEILYEQEKEIERLTNELNKRQPVTGSALVDAIVEAAEMTARAYLREVESSGEAIKAEAVRLEDDARDKYSRVKGWSEELIGAIRNLLREISEISPDYNDKVVKLRDDYETLFASAGLGGILTESRSWVDSFDDEDDANDADKPKDDAAYE